MTKTHNKIAVRNPFVPSLSPVCLIVEHALICTVAAAGIIAVLATIAPRLMGAF